jgi:hypothetical protein
MSQEQEKFDTFLKILKNINSYFHKSLIPPLFPNPRFNELIPPGPWFADFEPVVTIALTIMEKSNIFRNGKLNGGIKRKYGTQSVGKTYMIEDLELFMLRISHIIHLDSTNKLITSSYKPLITYYFNKVLADLATINYYLTDVTKTIRSDIIPNLVKKIDVLKYKALVKPIIPNISFSWNVAEQITILFKYHVPKANKEVISYRVSEVLNLFTIEIPPETIRNWLKHNKLPASYFTL